MNILSKQAQQAIIEAAARALLNTPKLESDPRIAYRQAISELCSQLHDMQFSGDISITGNTNITSAVFDLEKSRWS